ncbi:hypothetical protein ACH5RR_005134 [Cinchona calisaya]|uniref:Uncharacterized protein n=1 Tax=Cinchona calisaya TaxID=153742 RepID=A0ABD3AKB0_9GENT
MLSSNGPDFHNKSFHIKHDDSKFFSRLVSKESSTGNPSFRVYYGDVAGAVPFTWETRPGTPKHAFSDYSTLPPLTPPPSYYSHITKNPSSKKQSRSKLLRNLVMRINHKMSHLIVTTSLSSSSSSSLSSLSWSSSTPSSFRGRRRRFTSWGSSSFDGVGDDRLEMPNSRFCFPVGKNGKGNSVVTMKKNLLSMIGCGSR